MGALEKLAGLPSQVQQIRDGLEVLFKNLPSSPDTVPAGKGCFTMKLSALTGNVLDPCYYDYKTQHTALKDLIQTYPLDKMESKLLEVCKTGKITRSYTNTTKLHPDVLKFIQEACGYETKD
jgi:hypothetical protein